MSHLIRFSMILCLLKAIGSINAFAAGQDNFRRDDAFDMSQGAQVLGGSDVFENEAGRFDLRDIFGGDFGTFPNEPACIFATPPPAENTDWVEFMTAEDAPLEGYHLILGNEFPIFHRCAKIVRLKADLNRDGNWHLVDEVAVTNYLPRTIGVAITGDELLRTLPQRVVAQRWRIEFVRGSGLPVDPSLDGPRVYELDAVTTPNADRPLVTWISPETESSFQEPATLQFEATADDKDGINRIEFFYYAFDSTNYIGSGIKGPNSWKLEWSGVGAGVYEVGARAVDQLGGYGYSETVLLEVKGLAVEIKKPAVSPFGFFQFEAHQVSFGRDYTVEISGDLKNWAELVTFTAESDLYLFTDSVPAANRPRQFYRIVEPGGLQ